MAIKMTQLIFLASWDLFMAIPTQPFCAHLGRISDTRNDQDCETVLLCKYLSTHYLFLLTFYCLRARCTTLCFNFLHLQHSCCSYWLNYLQWCEIIFFFTEISLHFSCKSVRDIRKFRCVFLKISIPSWPSYCSAKKKWTEGCHSSRSD